MRLENPLTLQNTFVEFAGDRVPDVAPSGKARMYYDQSTGRVLTSTSGGSYQAPGLSNLADYTRTIATASEVGMTIVGASGQTGDLFRVQDSGAVNRVNINSSYELRVRNASGNTRVTLAGASTHLVVICNTASDGALVMTAAASQTSTMTEWRANGGTAYLTVGPPALAGNSLTANFLNLTATLPSTLSAGVRGVSVSLTSAGSSAQQVIGQYLELLAGYTGGQSTIALQFQNTCAGTGTGVMSGQRNLGLFGEAKGTTVGTNEGLFGSAENGNICVGVAGRAIVDKASGTNVGVCGIANNAGATPVVAGGYFGLQTADPTFATAALIADNGAIAAPICLFRDNGTVKLTVDDGGHLTFADAVNLIFGTTTGTQLGTSSSQKIGAYGATPVVRPSAYTQTYATASRTHSNPTAVTVTDNSGGSADTTLQAIGASYSQTEVRNNFADLAAQHNAVVADLANVKQVLNQVLDDLQLIGWLA
jgi:hypothetical protein